MYPPSASAKWRWQNPLTMGSEAEGWALQTVKQLLKRNILCECPPSSKVLPLYFPISVPISAQVMEHVFRGPGHYPLSPPWPPGPFALWPLPLAAGGWLLRACLGLTKARPGGLPGNSPPLRAPCGCSRGFACSGSISPLEHLFLQSRPWPAHVCVCVCVCVYVWHIVYVCVYGVCGIRVCLGVVSVVCVMHM